ncbi:protein PLANT CADMIUM RESISTANCE 3-like isoform X3 [Mizuhopecten yessoensis]|uniref:Protein PLANT CADMIUM RESISTANCE 3 n=1 Tax=Mizuhopecten yessoensis TaxID=6573 RepID=A0A210PJ95_MIZYE|nr:protein PLANT CADMIUM RESISTANCE 3-like isoform X3 [Mizuhopecten yessoensis]OWF36561.1 Protein PLANT CADMIUM RESISTANCE 3 [Mizuhopecten yessoensis]
MGEWANGLCGCMSNCTLCLITYIAPCYTAGKNAEAVGDSCIMVAVVWYLFPAAGAYLCAKVRGKIREQHQIEGGFGGDCLVHLFCPICALVQDAQQIRPGETTQGESMARE